MRNRVASASSYVSGAEDRCADGRIRGPGRERRVPSERSYLFDRVDAEAAAGMGRRTQGLTNASDKSNVSERALELNRPFRSRSCNSSQA